MNFTPEQQGGPSMSTRRALGNIEELIITEERKLKY